ncbi:hypothetical protein HAX54_017151 [Datura stramonium]|uniref:Uncharacterized protein n=1 Tax=Datura stramonium TaxID=4076 RepID=A0ABS8ULU7_DATST|nr:hypothetical protein [Datura stramonium]
MRGKIFMSGNKSFKIFKESGGLERWFVWVERGRRSTNQIKLDEENLKMVGSGKSRGKAQLGQSFWGAAEWLDNESFRYIGDACGDIIRVDEDKIPSLLGTHLC